MIHWPPEEPQLSASADRLLEELEQDAHAQRARGDEKYTPDYDRLSLLVSIAATTVPDGVVDFIGDLNALVGVLPGGIARSYLEACSPLDRDKDPGEGAIASMHRLFRDSRWHQMGRPVVRLDERLACALMSSDVSLDVLDELKSPWPSFRIRLPADLFCENGQQYTMLHVHTFQQQPFSDEMLTGVSSELAEVAMEASRRVAGQVWSLSFADASGHSPLGENQPLAALMGKRDRVRMLDLSPEPDQVAIRFIECAARLAAGVCLLIHESKIRKVSEKKNPSTRWRLSKLPLTAEYVVGADIVVRLDCREAIREYVSGERRKKPVCQWIVRGHWRNQACGPSLTERKRTWIEPYWKGPEREPILSREHVLVNAVPKG